MLALSGVLLWSCSKSGLGENGLTEEEMDYQKIQYLIVFLALEFKNTTFVTIIDFKIEIIFNAENFCCHTAL